MSLTQRIAHNTMIQFGGKIAGTILGLFAIAIMTRYLGQVGFGYYSTIMGFLQFFGILVDFGLTLTTAQLLSQSRALGRAAAWDEETLFANILGLRTVSAALFLGVAPLVVFLFPYPGLVKVGIAIGTLSFFFMSLNQIFLGFYQTHLKMAAVSVAEIGNRLFLLAAMVVIMRLDLGLKAVLWAVVISNVIQFALLILPALRLTRIRLALQPLVLKFIWSRTWPIALSIALNLLYLKTDIIVLSLYRSPEEVGLYGAAYKVVDVLTTFPILFAGILLPLLSGFWQSNDRTRFASLVQQGFDAMCVLAWPIMIGTIFLGHDVMALIAGEEFRAAGLLLQLLIWASGIIFFNAVFAHAIVALNRQKETIIAYAITAVVGVAGYFIFVPMYGSLGAAAMTIVTEGLVTILIFSAYLRFTDIKPSLRRWIPIAVSCAAMAVVLVFTPQQPFFVRFVLAVLVYGAVMLATGGISKTFVKELVTLRKSA
ncbi:MAG: flippase [Parcubacteria group bacterium]|nr:flippase [Parcubacteria group bacterium]